MINKIWKVLLWVMIKMLKVVIYMYVALAIIITIFGWQYFWRDEVWVDFTTNNIQGQILVPKDISKTKDCEKFFQWQHDNLPATMYGICPWYVYTPEREVTIGSLKLKIPRRYLSLGAEVKKDANMITTHSFIYPSLELEGHKYSHDSYFFTLEKGYDSEFEDLYKGYLWRFLDLTSENTTYNIVPLGYDDVKGYGAYRFDITFDNKGKKTTYQNFVYIPMTI